MFMYLGGNVHPELLFYPFTSSPYVGGHSESVLINLRNRSGVSQMGKIPPFGLLR